MGLGHEPEHTSRGSSQREGNEIIYLCTLKQVSNDTSLHAESKKNILTLTIKNYLEVDFFKLNP